MPIPVMPVRQRRSLMERTPDSGQRRATSEFPCSNSRGCTIGLYHNLGVDCTVTIRADITGANSSLSMQRPVIDSVIVASGATAFFASFPLAAGADATMRYVPQLNMPMYYAIVQILPASDPSSGTLYIAVAR